MPDAAEAINKVAVFACDFELGLEVAYQDYVRMVSLRFHSNDCRGPENQIFGG